MRSKIKIPCPSCKESFWSLQRFYAHIRVCEAGKKWKDESPCWETKLQGCKIENKNRKKEVLL